MVVPRAVFVTRRQTEGDVGALAAVGAASGAAVAEGFDGVVVVFHEPFGWVLQSVPGSVTPQHPLAVAPAGGGTFSSEPGPITDSNTSELKAA